MQEQSKFMHLYQLPYCPVCLSELSSSIAVLGCNHCFHRSCIEKVINEKCPTCRTQFKKYDIVDVIYHAIPIKKEKIQVDMNSLMGDNRKLKNQVMFLTAEKERVKRESKRQIERLNFKYYEQKMKTAKAEQDIWHYKNILNQKKQELKQALKKYKEEQTKFKKDFRQMVKENEKLKNSLQMMKSKEFKLVDPEKKDDQNNRSRDRTPVRKIPPLYRGKSVQHRGRQKPAFNVRSGQIARYQTDRFRP